MVKYISIVLVLFSVNLFALDWDKEKYDFPEKDPSFMAKVQPGTEEYYWLCEAAKTNVWYRDVELKEKEFIELVDKVSSLIITANEGSIIHRKGFYEEWQTSFRKAQLNWLKQLELDADAYWRAKSSLGGKYERSMLRYKFDQLNNRIDAIKNGMWIDYIKDFL